MPKILMIHTGGTLMMRSSDEGTPLEPEAYTSDLLTELPVLGTIAEIDSRILFNLDSGDIQPHHWVELAREIHGELDAYDGFVVVHGTDAMAYTASALAFLLPGLDRPVVLTGAQRPIFQVRTDARTNLVDACHIATLDVPEVGIAFADKLFRGSRTTKLDAWGLDAFASPLCQPLVELGLGVFIGPHVLDSRVAGGFDPRIDPRVICLRVFPGFDPELIEHAVDAGTRGIVLEAYGTGNLPHIGSKLLSTIEGAIAREVPVVIVSQCPRGFVDLTLYRGGASAAAAGAISGGDMTTEAALAKLMVMLGRAPKNRRLDFVRNAFARPLLGEMTTRRNKRKR